MQTVYLAGPITGCDKSEAQDWRDYAINQLALYGILGISPLRCEPIVGKRYGSTYQDPKFGTSRAIGSKNLFDVQHATMTLAYLPEDMRRISLGTVVELAWAYAFRKPAILVSTHSEIINHPVVTTCAAWILPTLDDAIDTLRGILFDYNGHTESQIVRNIGASRRAAEQAQTIAVKNACT